MARGPVGIPDDANVPVVGEFSVEVEVEVAAVVTAVCAVMGRNPLLGPVGGARSEYSSRKGRAVDNEPDGGGLRLRGPRAGDRSCVTPLGPAAGDGPLLAAGPGPGEGDLLRLFPREEAAGANRSSEVRGGGDLERSRESGGGEGDNGVLERSTRPRGAAAVVAVTDPRLALAVRCAANESSPSSSSLVKLLRSRGGGGREPRRSDGPAGRGGGGGEREKDRRLPSPP